MTHSYQFVDAISASAEVLLDLDDQAPFWVAEGSSVSPPKLRRSTSPRLLGDGSMETDSSYEDRVVRLQLGVELVAAETQAAAIQTLVRILDGREGAWLKWQSEGMSEPHFYRTKRADVEVIDEILDAKPDRTLNIEIPADPFGYGLPVEGTVTITNDPTTGTNKMRAVLDAIEGDVATPLNLSFPTPDDDHKITWASEALFDGSTPPAAPYYQALSTPAVDASPLSGWTITDAVDATMVSGNRRRVSGSNSSLPLIPTSATVLQWTIPRGDYRVMVRVAGADEGTELLFFNRAPANGATFTRDDAATSYTVPSTSTGHDWFDLGVAAMPGGAPITDNVFGLDDAPGPALWNVGVYAEASVTLDLDAVVLVPAGRPGTLTRHGSAAFPSTHINKVVRVDGINGRRDAKGESSLAAGVVVPVAASEVAGGLPLVVPGAANVLNFFATTAIDSATREDDDKALTTVIDFLYHPLHAYDRPST